LWTFFSKVVITVDDPMVPYLAAFLLLSHSAVAVLGAIGHVPDTSIGGPPCLWVSNFVSIQAAEDVVVDDAEEAVWASVSKKVEAGSAGAGAAVGAAVGTGLPSPPTPLIKPLARSFLRLFLGDPKLCASEATSKEGGPAAEDDDGVDVEQVGSAGGEAEDNDVVDDEEAVGPAV
jgi:hypothetical protein